MKKEKDEQLKEAIIDNLLYIVAQALKQVDRLRSGDLDGTLLNDVRSSRESIEKLAYVRARELI